MEHERQLRFLIPPFIFAAALFWGAILDPGIRVREYLASQGAETQVSRLIPILFAGGIVIVAMGFLISAVSIATMRVLFVLLRRLGYAVGGYEGAVSKEAYPALWFAVTREKRSVNEDMMYAVAAFDHWLLPKGLHAWVGRRWNVFMVSFNVVIAIFFAHLVAMVHVLRIQQTWTWVFSDCAVIVLLSFNAFVARHQALNMLGFAAVHSIREKTPPSGG